MLGGRVARRSRRRASLHLFLLLLLLRHRRRRYLMMSANNENGGGLNRQRMTWFTFGADDTDATDAKTRGKRVFCSCPTDRDMTDNFATNRVGTWKEEDDEE